ncbi:MAG: hypothetical protein CVV64_06810 [Candidatus Wallbacteria bacterium HGW-Wallbacteria-1]|jgi:HEAT repeat protein|uniref:HEAT repeat domain-containing protein n=1 Tax=Candidatus Wallbacteria bacterium HGW-Wallbacteria-1 TaxID=2013854 RepID=A0A2N1PT06_9BACT|nr:MAG: hypothetical protein CVV64_06810 [Candidatus Wallbacteria bacterium HGW-Wallbacteria-1]
MPVQFWKQENRGVFIHMDQETRKHVAEMLRGTGDDCLKALRVLESFSSDREAISILVTSLAHPKWKIRKAAADLLGKVGPSAMKDLIEAMESSNEDRSFWAIRILGDMGAKAVPFLAGAFNKTRDKDRRYNVVSALGSTNSVEAIGPLVEALRDGSWSVRREASNQLLLMGQESLPQLKKGCASKDPNLKYWSIKTLARIMGSDALGSLKEIVQNPDSKARYYAVLALGEIHDPAAADLLIEALGDESWIVRKLAADQLLRHGKECVPKLVTAFEKGSPDVRYWSIQLIGKILKGNAIGSLGKILREGDESLRNYAILALGETRSEKAIPLLIKAFADPSWVVREQASDILASFGKKALSHLEKAIQSDHEDIRFWAIRVLSKMAEQGFRVLADSLSWLDSKTRLFAIDTISDNIDAYPEEVMELFINCLSDSHWPVRRKAYEGLVKVGSSVIPAILEKVASQDPDIKYWCGKVIDHFGRDTASSLIRIFGSGNVEASDHILNFFQEVTSPSLIEELLENPNIQREETRYYLVKLLSRVHGKALNTLKSAAEKGGPAQALAIEALGRVQLPGIMKALTGLKHMDRNASLALMKVMAEKRDPESLEFLIRSLESNDEERRNLATQLLGTLGDTKFLDAIPRLVKGSEFMVNLILPQIVSSIVAAHAEEVSQWALQWTSDKTGLKDIIAALLAGAALQSGSEKAREFFGMIMNEWPIHMADPAIRSLRNMEPAWFPEMAMECAGKRNEDLRDATLHVLDGFSNPVSVVEKFSQLQNLPNFIKEWCAGVKCTMSGSHGISAQDSHIADTENDSILRLRELESMIDELMNQPRHQFNSRIAAFLKMKPGTIATLSDDFGVERLSRALITLLRSGVDKISEMDLRNHLRTGKARK